MASRASDGVEDLQRPCGCDLIRCFSDRERPQGMGSACERDLASLTNSGRENGVAFGRHRLLRQGRYDAAGSIRFVRRRPRTSYLISHCMCKFRPPCRGKSRTGCLNEFGSLGGPGTLLRTNIVVHTLPTLPTQSFFWNRSLMSCRISSLARPGVLWRLQPSRDQCKK